jgi:hypothetical protein
MTARESRWWLVRETVFTLNATEKPVWPGDRLNALPPCSNPVHWHKPIAWYQKSLYTNKN